MHALYQEKKSRYVLKRIWNQVQWEISPGVVEEMSLIITSQQKSHSESVYGNTIEKGKFIWQDPV